MRQLSLAFIGALGLIAVGASTADAAEWCAVYGPYSRNCGFHTFRQCQETISGVGGICERNPRFHWDQRERRR